MKNNEAKVVLIVTICCFASLFSAQEYILTNVFFAKLMANLEERIVIAIGSMYWANIPELLV